MLVLSRERDEVIEIGDHIRVTVCEVRPCGQVRLGIDAPKEMPVHRQEVADKIREFARGKEEVPAAKP